MGCGSSSTVASPGESLWEAARAIERMRDGPAHPKPPAVSPPAVPPPSALPQADYSSDDLDASIQPVVGSRTSTGVFVPALDLRPSSQASQAPPSKKCPGGADGKPGTILAGQGSRIFRVISDDDSELQCQPEAVALGIVVESSRTASRLRSQHPEIPSPARPRSSTHSTASAAVASTPVGGKARDIGRAAQAAAAAVPAAGQGKSPQRSLTGTWGSALSVGGAPGPAGAVAAAAGAARGPSRSLLQYQQVLGVSAPAIHAAATAKPVDAARGQRDITPPIMRVQGSRRSLPSTLAGFHAYDACEAAPIPQVAVQRRPRSISCEIPAAAPHVVSGGMSALYGRLAAAESELRVVREELRLRRAAQASS